MIVSVVDSYVVPSLLKGIMLNIGLMFRASFLFNLYKIDVLCNTPPHMIVYVPIC